MFCRGSNGESEKKEVTHTHPSPGLVNFSTSCSRPVWNSTYRKKSLRSNSTSLWALRYFSLAIRVWIWGQEQNVTLDQEADFRVEALEAWRTGEATCALPGSFRWMFENVSPAFLEINIHLHAAFRYGMRLIEKSHGTKDKELRGKHHGAAMGENNRATSNTVRL